MIERRIIAAISLILLATTAGAAQAQGGRPLGVWILGGAGLMGTNASDGFGLTIQLAARRAPHQVTLRASAGGAVGGSSETFGDAGLLYGRTLVGVVGHLSASGGAGVAQSADCDGCDSELSPALLAGVEASLRVMPTIGIGMQLLGNVTGSGAMIGLMATLQFGWLPDR